MLTPKSLGSTANQVLSRQSMWLNNRSGLRLCGCRKARNWTLSGCWDVEIVSPVVNVILVRDYACVARSFLILVVERYDVEGCAA